MRLAARSAVSVSFGSAVLWGDGRSRLRDRGRAGCEVSGDTSTTGPVLQKPQITGVDAVDGE